MEKFEPIKMQELLSVSDPDADGGLTLTFQNGTSLRIRISDDKLVSEFSS